MAYIGRGLDKISNIEHLDTITFDGSSSYSLTKSSVAFTPNSAQSLLVSIDGVVQSNNFTVSGSTIDFGVAVPSTSTCDFIKHFGTGVAFTPADGTVSSAQLGTGAITGQTALAESPASDDQFLIYDTSATSFKKLAASYVGGNNTPAFKAIISSASQSFTNSTVTKIQFDSEVFDTDGCYDATTNYRFTPTTAGKYFVYLQFAFDSSVAWDGLAGVIEKNGSFDNVVVYRHENFHAVTMSHIVDMNGTTDYLEAFGQQNSGGSLSLRYNSGYDYNLFGAFKLIGV